MERSTGYGLIFFLIATILHGKIAMSKAEDECMENNPVIILPDNAHYDITQGHALKGHLLSSIQTTTYTTCASRCTRNEDCKSFNYSPGTRTCELNNGNDESNPGDLEPDSSFEYFNYAWSKFKGCTFTTPSDYCYQFLFPRLPDGTKRLEFSVKTGGDAFIGLTTESRITDTMYEIDIGGNSGTSIFIRKCKECVDLHVDIPDIVSDQEYRRFWITFENGLIRVGRHLDTTPIVEWQDTGGVISVHYVSFASFLSHSGDWVLHSFCDLPGY